MLGASSLRYVLSFPHDPQQLLANKELMSELKAQLTTLWHGAEGDFAPAISPQERACLAFRKKAVRCESVSSCLLAPLAFALSWLCGRGQLRKLEVSAPATRLQAKQHWWLKEFNQRLHR